MYSINRTENTIKELDKKSFSQLGYHERSHVQEWIAKNPSCLGENLLVIQKEFDGFSETNERLDLLAIDKHGNLVIIENKLDSSGKDLTWQVIKYASYCSTLTKEQITNIFQEYLFKQNGTHSAEEKLSEFFDNKDFPDIVLNQPNTQRIIMVAGVFKKEVTSAVIWLRNNGLRIQCIRIRPYVMGDNEFLDIEQILPIKDTEEFMIRAANKAQEDAAVKEELKARDLIRFDFWKLFLSESNKRNSLFANISPSSDNWIGIGIGLSGINLNVIVTLKYAAVEIYFNRGKKEENERLFEVAESLKSDIESTFGGALIWVNKPENVTCRILTKMEGVSVLDKTLWPEMIFFLIDNTERIFNAMREPLKKLNAFAKSEIKTK